MAIRPQAVPLLLPMGKLLGALVGSGAVAIAPYGFLLVLRVFLCCLCPLRAAFLGHPGDGGLAFWRGAG
jgi:hypothetical protein